MTHITIEPNYEALFRNMLAEARNQSEARSLFRDRIGFGDQDRAELLREVQRFLAPLNIAAQSMTSAQAVEQFRDALADMVTGINAEACRLESRVDEAASAPGADRGLL